MDGSAAAAKSPQSCPTLCNTIDGSPPGSPVPGILQARTLGVGCHFLLQCMKVKSESEVAQSCPTLSDLVDCSPPGSSVHGILQARTRECIAITFSRMDGWITVKLGTAGKWWYACLLFFLSTGKAVNDSGAHRRQADAHREAQNSGTCCPEGCAYVVPPKRQAWTHQSSKDKVNKALCAFPHLFAYSLWSSLRGCDLITEYKWKWF